MTSIHHAEPTKQVVDFPNPHTPIPDLWRMLPSYTQTTAPQPGVCGGGVSYNGWEGIFKSSGPQGEVDGKGVIAWHFLLMKTTESNLVGFGN